MALSKINLLNLLPYELEEWMRVHKLEPYRARQIFLWVYKKNIFNFDQMTDLPFSLRNELKNYFYFHLPQVVERKFSPDGAQKFLLELEDKKYIESVFISESTPKENSLCLSTQVGCKFGCSFCATATIGFQRNLSAGEIIGQYLVAQSALTRKNKIDRLVFMGMGEPLDNWQELKKALSVFTSRKELGFSPRRITVSTAGIIPLIPELWALGVNVALSINAPDNKKRAELMPINQKYPLGQLVKTIRGLDISTRQKLTCEYVLLKGINDSLEDAEKLAWLLAKIPIRVNLIALNPFPGSEFSSPEPSQVLAFQEKLRSAGLMAFIRKSAGREILAGCGQLAGRR